MAPEGSYWHLVVRPTEGVWRCRSRDDISCNGRHFSSGSLLERIAFEISSLEIVDDVDIGRRIRPLDEPADILGCKGEDEN